MGDKLTESTGQPALQIPPWLDRATASLTEDIVWTLILHRSDMLAVILYGSVARHNERAVTDAHPSDVDLFAIFDTDDEDFAIHQGKELFNIIGHAYDRHLDILRDVKVMFASRSLDEWDSTFIANIAHDGVLLWSRGPLPDTLSPVANRAFVTSDPATEPEQAI